MERREADVQHRLHRHPALGVLVHHHELLGVLDPGRHHHPAAGLELGEQQGRHEIRRRGDQDAVERPVLGPAPRAVAVAQRDILVAQRVQPGARARGEIPDDLDRTDLGGQLGQQRRLVAEPGSHLEHRVIAPHVEQIGHQRVDIRLRDGLAAADRQRRIDIGEAAQLDRHEFVARHPADRLHDPRIQRIAPDLFRGQADMMGDLGDHFAPRADKMQIVHETPPTEHPCAGARLPVRPALGNMR